MNKVILMGNLAADPELRTAQSGVNVCTMRIAVQRNYVNQQGVREADFFNIVAFKQRADFCSRYLKKGSKILVEGSLQTRTYDAQDGSKRYITEVVAENIEFAERRSAEGTGNYGGAAQAQPAAPSPRPAAAPQVSAQNSGFTEVEDDDLPF